MKDNALYLEVDEDITSAIDKLTKSTGTSVQIVVPKRSSMLQSIINLKLLKKAAEKNGKELVLVTNDRVATDLAGRVGLAVAPSLGAKAVIAEAEIPEDLKSVEEVIDDSDPEPPPPPPQTAPLVAIKPGKPKLLRRELTDESPAADVPADSAPDEPSQDAPKGPKVPKVPNFGRMQRRVLWIGSAVILVVGYILFMNFFTSAKVVLFANGTQVSIDENFTVNPNVSTSDPANGVLAGQLVTVTKNLSGSFTPTGKQTIGTQAAGTMTVFNSYDQNSHELVAGTRFQAPDGNIFRSTATVTVPGATVTLSGGTPTVTPGQVQVAVQANQNGDSYNEAPASYSIPGLPSNEQSQKNGIYGQGSQMSGGSTKVVSVVMQSDVDTEQATLVNGDKASSSSTINAHIPPGYIALSASQGSSVSNVSPSPAVGAQGDTGTLTLKVTYSVLAIKSSEYHAIVDAQEQKQIGSGQQIYDDGLSSANVTDQNAGTTGTQTFTLTTVAYSGAKLNTTAIASQLSGKKYGDASDTANGLAGVSHSTITVWPAWASNLPSRAGKIKVSIQVAKAQ